MDDHHEVKQAAGRARGIMMRVAGTGGILQQIEAGEWDDRIPNDSSEMRDLLEAMAERARLDRIILDRFAAGPRA